MPETSGVLVFHVGSLGDTIVSIPALRAIRKHWTGHEITLLHNEIPPHLAGPRELLEGLDLVDRFLTYPSSGGLSQRLAGAGRCWASLRRMRFDALVYLMRERPVAAMQRDRNFFALAGIQRERQFGFLPQNHLSACVHESRQVLGRLRELGVDPDAGEYFRMPLLTPPSSVRQKMAEFLRQRRRTPERELVAICPGTKMPAKLWPLDNFVKLARRVTLELECEAVLLGGPADTEAAQRICLDVPGTIDACGRLSILEVAAVLEQCRTLVGLDTGTTHLAAAVGTAVVGLYAARNTPGQWDPLGEGHTVLRADVPCGGCGVEVCPVPGHPCMTGLSVEQVFAAVCRMVRRPAIV